MTLTFHSYQIRDDGIALSFSVPVAGGGLNFYHVFLADAELAAITTQAQLRTRVTDKLRRKLQAAGIAAKLDGFIGQEITI